MARKSATRCRALQKLIRHYDLAGINVGFKDSASGATVKPVIVY
jgi:Zn-dependent alcohol dehydrogenase